MLSNGHNMSSELKCYEQRQDEPLALVGDDSPPLLTSGQLGFSATVSVASNSEPISSDDWIFLNVGDEVVVQRVGDCHRKGEIDDISDDARTFWVQLSEGRGRVMIFEGDGSEVCKRCL